MSRLLTTNQMVSIFGTPNETGRGYLTTLRVPYVMRLAWDLTTEVHRISCHHLVAENFRRVFEDLLDYYGEEDINKLHINYYGGCFNYRRMRGGRSWSKHAWGTAIDLDPARNLLKESSRTARFARAEYKPMINIFYDHGFISLGVEKNYDWMHFEHAGKLFYN